MRYSKGFTLVELVIVIAVIAVISTVLLVSFTGVIDNANDAKSAFESKQNEKQDVIDSIFGGDSVDASGTTADTENDDVTAGGMENMNTVECADAAKLRDMLEDTTLENTVIKLTGDDEYTFSSDVYVGTTYLCVMAKNCVLDLNGRTLDFKKPSGVAASDTFSCMTINEAFSIVDTAGEASIKTSGATFMNMFLINADLSVSGVSVSFQTETEESAMFKLQIGNVVLSDVSATIKGIRIETYYFLDSSAGTNMKIESGTILFDALNAYDASVSVGGDFSISSDCVVDDGNTDVLTPYIK